MRGNSSYSIEEYKVLLKKQKPAKYRSKRTFYNGIWYDSKDEAEYAEKLEDRVKRNFLSWWLRQVKVPLGPDDSLRVDFLVPSVCDVYAVEVKGFETKDFKRKKKLWKKYGPFPLCVVFKNRENEWIQPEAQ